MQCPIDGTPLVITDRSGVEIDYCPQCRGVWLDRGELDKIIERAAAYSAPPPPPEAPRAQPDRDYDDRGDDDRGDRRYDQRRGRRKKGMGDLLGDIFDF
ncbi:zf-TFIIB domain-containing protein [uncultured Tateyamaria sp.]|uniref:TFIIB-type zinc ribbon-containing protein n=1 Tax=uncultured Tateyamaria sp. TaxID=455651 RepID=UPI00262E52A9|nr:zf-TFIIB domain-containing protein [uncultured Tateyamaria sp.]